MNDIKDKNNKHIFFLPFLLLYDVIIKFLFNGNYLQNYMDVTIFVEVNTFRYWIRMFTYIYVIILLDVFFIYLFLIIIISTLKEIKIQIYQYNHSTSTFSIQHYQMTLITMQCFIRSILCMLWYDLRIFFIDYILLTTI